MRRLLIALLFAVALSITLVSTADAAYSQNWNSSEVGCDGTNANYVFCSDMETSTTPFTRQGWARCNVNVSNCGGAPGSGRANQYNHGWDGEIDPASSWPDETGEINAQARCGGLGATGTNCAHTSGLWKGTPGGIGQGVMGKHRFLDSGGNIFSLTEWYYRWYIKQLPGFVAGHEKIFTFQHNTNSFQSVFMNKPFGSSTWDFDVIAISGWRQEQNQGNNLSVVNGRWYAFEVHIKLNSNGGCHAKTSPTDPSDCDGILEMWANDCGVDGLGCPAGTGSQTLRLQYLDLKFRSNTATEVAQELWFEAWGNPMSQGEEYYDQLILSRTRIGWAQLAGGGPSTFQQGTADPLSPAEAVRRQAGKTSADAIAPQEDLGSRKGQAVRERLGIRRKLTP